MMSLTTSTKTQSSSEAPSVCVNISIPYVDVHSYDRGLPTKNVYVGNGRYFVSHTKNLYMAEYNIVAFVDPGKLSVQYYVKPVGMQRGESEEDLTNPDNWDSSGSFFIPDLGTLIETHTEHLELEVSYAFCAYDSDEYVQYYPTFEEAQAGYKTVMDTQFCESSIYGETIANNFYDILNKEIRMRIKLNPRQEKNGDTVTKLIFYRRGHCPYLSNGFKFFGVMIPEVNMKLSSIRRHCSEIKGEPMIRAIQLCLDTPKSTYIYEVNIDCCRKLAPQLYRMWELTRRNSFTPNAMLSLRRSEHQYFENALFLTLIMSEDGISIKAISKFLRAELIRHPNNFYRIVDEVALIWSVEALTEVADMILQSAVQFYDEVALGALVSLYNAITIGNPHSLQNAMENNSITAIELASLIRSAGAWNSCRQQRMG